MRKLVVFSVLFVLIIAGCGKKSEIVQLEKGTPAYDLAKEISSKLTFFDPDSNKILVTTKDFAISTGEIFQFIYDNRGIQSSQLAERNIDQLKSIIGQTAQRLADQKLVLNDAKKAGFSVPQAVTDSVIMQQFSHAGGEEKFIEMITKNNVSIETVKNEIQKNVLFNQFLDETLGKEIQISDEEIQKAYDDYTSKEIATVRHILLMTQGKSDAEKVEIRTKMEVILARARQGEDFAELAKEFTEDPGSKETGGLYEDFSKGRMVKPFEDAAFSVPVGEISDVVETRYGYHILQILARNNFKSIEEYRPELEEQLKGSKKPEAYQAYMTKIKEAAQYKMMDF